MTLKKVWGVIIIVAGLLLAYVSARDLHEIITVGQVFSNSIIMDIYSLPFFKNIVIREKLLCSFLIIIGVCMTIIGSCILKSIDDYQIVAEVDEPNNDFSDNNWKL